MSKIPRGRHDAMKATMAGSDTARAVSQHVVLKGRADTAIVELLLEQMLNDYGGKGEHAI